MYGTAGLRKRTSAGDLVVSTTTVTRGGSDVRAHGDVDIDTLRLLSPSALRQRLRDKARALVLGDQTRSLRAALRAELQKPRRVQLKDKISFTLGVLNLCATEAVVLLRPDLFGLWYTLWAVPLLAYRYYSYTRNKWGYFLIDYCYMVNALSLLHLWVYPRSPLVFELAFMSANGPLAWAILAWRNSLVFHDIDKITSLFIHAAPPLLMYTQRWHYRTSSAGGQQLPAYLQCGEATAAGKGHYVSGGGPASCSRSYWDGLLLPVAFYVVWQAGYFLKTEIMDAERMRRDPTIQVRKPL